MSLRDAAIGIFDSGIGGLTVAREVARRLPNEHLIYLGDTARLPYGSKSPVTVSRYAATCVDFLRREPLKAIVIACNTASALALADLEHDLEVPLLGVIAPGARAAARTSRGGVIGVIGQEGTVRSGSYPRAIESILPSAKIVSHACPLLVPLAEEGWLTGEVPRLTLRRYLEPLACAKIDTLVLGCTHYPLFKTLINDVFTKDYGMDVRLVDSAEEVTAELCDLLTRRGRLNGGGPGRRRFFCTDAPERFAVVGRRFFGDEFTEVRQVDLNASRP